MENILAVRDGYRLQGWSKIIQECQASGLSNREFCTQRGIPEKKYYYWLRKLRKTAAASMPPPQLVRLEESSGASEKRWIEIRYGEAELKLPEDVDLKAVVSLLHALRSHD